MAVIRRKARVLKVKQRQSNPFKRLGDLSPDRLNYVENSLLKGISCASIAKTMQQEWYVFNDVQTNTVEKMLHRYKQDVLKLDLAITSELIDPEEQRNLIQKVNAVVDPILELQEIAMVQKKRVRISLEREKTLLGGVLLEQASREIMNLTTMMDKLGRLMIDLGIAKKFISGMKDAPTAGGDSEDFTKFMEVIATRVPRLLTQEKE